MVPLIAAADLDANPAFARLWEFVTRELVAEDASSLGKERERERNWRWRATRKTGGRRSRRGKVDGRDQERDDDEGDEEEDEEEDDGDGKGNKKEKRQSSDLSLDQHLHALRVARAKRRILCDVLDDAGAYFDVSAVSQSQSQDKMTPEADPSQSLGELVRVIAAYLHVNLIGVGSLLGEGGEDEEDLLYEDILRFKANIDPIANAVSSRLVEIESSLCALSNIALEHSDGSEDEREARAQSNMGHSLSGSIQTQLSRLSDLRDNLLPSSLTTLSTNLQQLLTLQRQLLQLQIQHLETSKHGVLSRYTMSNIAFLDTVAQTMALKAQVLLLEARIEVECSPQAERRREVIREKMVEVEKEDAELDDRISVLEGVLAEYEAADPDGTVMPRLGRRYKEIEEEMEGVKRDIEMLQRQAAKR
ncbi:uncharacterized protein Z520_08027 [Fonsecaea multimorphosa CBS 102226]|uniref:Uncharacterized protein n=1 Tax=Fonsecaea multimorphosa CBS 102226 TaxID=1442371 RepID=A0A0D2K041_9EURO|nr:uncharacterized protein Z520_08027 [Fonsecaea multimorphosa CBS 102226]KIX96249.1 hypothetical protein Z520_08027 [Fonsecaea multimorphosa CBS 102226]OAL21912.1 hypothetical protein AYO22_07509 [Fonsecaea multimorphosa]